MVSFYAIGGSRGRLATIDFSHVESIEKEVQNRRHAVPGDDSRPVADRRSGDPGGGHSRLLSGSNDLERDLDSVGCRRLLPNRAELFFARAARWTDSLLDA